MQLELQFQGLACRQVCCWDEKANQGLLPVLYYKSLLPEEQCYPSSINKPFPWLLLPQEMYCGHQFPHDGASSITMLYLHGGRYIFAIC